MVEEEDFLRLAEKKGVRLLDTVPLLVGPEAAGKKGPPGVDHSCSVEAVSRLEGLQREAMTMTPTAAASLVAKCFESETASWKQKDASEKESWIHPVVPKNEE